MKKLALLVLIISSQMTGAQEAAKQASHEEAEALIKQWIATENLISKEATEWEVKKAHLTQMSEIFTEQVKVLDEDLAAGQWEESDFEKKSETLKKSITSSEEARKAAMSFVKTAAPRVSKLAGSFPEPLVKELEQDITVLSQQVSNENVRELLRTLIHILQKAETFNRAFTFHEQTLTIKGEEYRAQVIYFGLSSAFFKAGKKHGVGSPGTGGWTFTEKPELRAQIEKGFAVHEGSVPSALFKLPLKLKGGE